MAQILLHKEPLTPKQIEQLDKSGVIAIQTQRSKSFHFLDLHVPQIEMNDMIWACLDAASTKDSYASDVRNKIIANLAKLVNEKRGAAAQQEPSK